jgi:undecaprenyl-phosphate 4-deoxy-4-formamido-L-arabinose transferase
VEVAHEERAAGESKYSLSSLMRLNFDLMTGYSRAPLQFFTLLGMITSGIAAFFVAVLLVRRLLVGPEAEGLFTLFGITLFLVGIALFGLGLLGEYVGRIYQQVQARPHYMVQAVLEQSESERP